MARPSNRARASLVESPAVACATPVRGASSPRWGAATPSLMGWLTDVAPHKFWGRGLYHPCRGAVQRPRGPLMRLVAPRIWALARPLVSRPLLPLPAREERCSHRYAGYSALMP